MGQEERGAAEKAGLVAKMFERGCTQDEIARRVKDAAFVRAELERLTGRREFYALYSNTKRGE